MVGIGFKEELTLLKRAPNRNCEAAWNEQRAATQNQLSWV